MKCEEMCVLLNEETHEAKDSYHHTCHVITKLNVNIRSDHPTPTVLQVHDAVRGEHRPPKPTKEFLFTSRLRKIQTRTMGFEFFEVFQVLLLIIPC